jgi:predicted RNA-binding Zn-ribbon protein involved in translation (DUF1610 family)
MPDPVASETVDFACPHCGGAMSTHLERLGDAVTCPACGMPVQSPEPRPVRPSGPKYQFQCLRCGSLLEAWASQAGKSARCPSCDAEFVVPPYDERTGLARMDADPGRDGELPAPVHAYAAAGQKAPRIVRLPDDSLVIECPRCGRQSPPVADNCRSCGLPFTIEGTRNAAILRRDNGGALTLALGISSVAMGFCGGIGLLPATLGLVIGLVQVRQVPDRIDGACGAGIVISIVGALVSVLALSGAL